MTRALRLHAFLLLVVLAVLVLSSVPSLARAQVTNPSSNSVGVSGSLTGPPPTEAATIATPTNGQSFTTQVVTLSGLCPKELLLKVFSNDVFVGSILCTTGSYTIQVSLFAGANELYVRGFDFADQQGPDSNRVTVTYNTTQFTGFTDLVTLTSVFARKGADPGKKLIWPILLSGGTGPYAVSVDWGDGQQPTLLSLRTPGAFDIDHVYSSAGVYQVVVKVTDVNGATAFLQLVGVANGKAATIAQGGSSSGSGNGSSGGSDSGSNGGGAGSATIYSAQVRFLTAVSVILIIFLVPAFWLGRKYELLALHRKIERDAEQYAQRESKL